jgi:L-ascorbate metabolism protein UlaG (beta-lactamase superfamily)
MRRHVLAAAFLVAALGPLTGAARLDAQPPGKAFKLRWFGQSFFQLETPNGKKIVFDPHAIPEFNRTQVVSADVIICTHLHNDHAQPEVVEGYKAARVFHGLKEKGKARTPDWNKIDEKVGGIHIRNLGTYHDAENGMVRGKNSVFVVSAEGLTVCHLGDLGHELSPEQVKALGPVDVLLVPVGGVYTINGETARRVVAAVKPRRFVVPMHYGVPGYDDLLPVDEFLDGLANVKKLPHTNELVIPPGAAADGTPAVVVLAPKPGETGPKK